MSWNWPRIRTIAFGILAGVVASAGTLAVTVAGFALSYDAIRAVGVASRIRTEWAWLLPVSVDGAMAVATIAAVVLRRMTGETAWYPWAVVLVGAGISIACNGLHAIPPAGAALVIEQSQVRFAVSAIPAVMLALSVHLLVTLVEAASGASSKPREMPRPAAHPRDEKPSHAIAQPAAHPTAHPVAEPIARPAAQPPRMPAHVQLPQVARPAAQVDTAPARRGQIVLRTPVEPVAEPSPDEREAAMLRAVARVRGGEAVRGAAKAEGVPESTLRTRINKTNGHQFELAAATSKEN